MKPCDNGFIMMCSPGIAALRAGILALCLVVPTAAAQAPPALAASREIAPRIIGGAPSGASENPWQVLLIINDRSLCGGSLIASTWILTAAHCMKDADASGVKAWAGISALSERSEQNRLPASRVIVHPQYDATTLNNDVALIELASPWTPSAGVAAIPLPVAQDPATWPAAGTLATVSGWGYLGGKGPSATVLHRATVHVLSAPDGTCGSYGTTYRPGSHVCAGEATGGVDTCQGDSGGPLVIDVGGVRVLAGVTSAGNECALADYPGLYTRVTSHLPWIRDTAGIPLTPPATPEAAAAAAIAGGRVVVAWTAPDAASFVVTSAPGGMTCETTELTCVVSGLTPGTAYAFTVQAANSAGSSAVSAPTPTVVAVDGTTSVGRTVKQSTVFRWAGVPLSASSTMRSLTPLRCRVVGRGLDITKAGVCRASVKTGRKSAVVVIGAQS